MGLDFVSIYSYQEMKLILDSLPEPSSAIFSVERLDYDNIMEEIKGDFPTAQTDRRTTCYFIKVDKPNVESILRIYEKQERMSIENGLQYHLNQINWDNGISLTPEALKFKGRFSEPEYFIKLKKDLIGENNTLEITISKD
jgi:hypothetical protein